MNTTFVIILFVVILVLFAIVIVTVLVSHQYDIKKMKGKRIINANKFWCNKEKEECDVLFICDSADYCSKNKGNCYKSRKEICKNKK